MTVVMRAFLLCSSVRKAYDKRQDRSGSRKMEEKEKKEKEKI